MPAPEADPREAVYARNLQYAKPDLYFTALPPADEAAFRGWVAQNRVPFDPNDGRQDYDMRGYWRDVVTNGGSGTQVNENDGRLHYPDTYKTPYHQSFSAESKYAKPGAPVWINDHQLADPKTNQIIFDERPLRK